MNMWQQVVEEFQVTFAVEDDDGDVTRVFRRANSSRQILADNVAEKGGLAGTGHAQHDTLHYADLVGPKPGFAVNIVAKHNRVVSPCLACESFIAFRRHHQRRAGPLLLAPRSSRGQKPYAAASTHSTDDHVQGYLLDLGTRKVVAVAGDVPGEPANRQDNHSDENFKAFEKWWVFAPVVVGRSHRHDHKLK